MKKVPKRPVEVLWKHVLPLAKNCPVNKCRPEECPLSLVSKQTPAQQAAALNALSEDDLAYLAAYCHVCMEVQLSVRALGTRSP